MIENLAYLASFLFVTATAAQAIKCWKDGNADGLSHILIWKLIVGFSIMTIYTVEVLNCDPVLMFAYTGQLSLFMIITKYKYFPRN